MKHSKTRCLKSVLLALCMVVAAGCSRAPDTVAVTGKPNPEVEDGGVVKNADRDTAQDYLGRLAKVQSGEEEKKLLTEFAQWLKTKEYKVRVEVKNGKHVLSCPYFPPVTPWTDHTFVESRIWNCYPSRHLRITRSWLALRLKSCEGATVSPTELVNFQVPSAVEFMRKYIGVMK